jgi:hypothetical protein
MLKLNAFVALICAMFLSAPMYAQSGVGEQPKGQTDKQTSSSSQSGVGEQPKGAAGAAAKSQDQPAAGTQQSGNDVSPRAQVATEPVKTTVRGCVQAGERVTLTDSSGNTFFLRGDANGLKGKDKRVVEVSGQQYPPASRESAAAIPTLEVQTVRQVADTCPPNIHQRGQQPASRPNASQPNAATTPYGGPREGPQGTQSAPPDAVLNTQGAGGAPSPGTGNNPPPPQSPPAPPPR